MWENQCTSIVDGNLDPRSSMGQIPLNINYFINAKYTEYYSTKYECLQCFDAVGWVAGRASGL